MIAKMVHYDAHVHVLLLCHIILKENVVATRFDSRERGLRDFSVRPRQDGDDGESIWRAA